MDLPSHPYVPSTPPLVDFIGQSIVLEGTITLPLTLGQENQSISKEVEFMMVDVPSLYNAIVNQCMLNSFSCVTSTYHLKMNFPTLTRVGKVCGDQWTARECYVNALKETLQVDTTNPREHDINRSEPMGDLENIPLGPINHAIWIGKLCHLTLSNN